MNMTCKNVVTIPMLLVLATWSFCFQTTSRGAEETPGNLRGQIPAAEEEDFGLLPMDQASRFSARVLEESSRAGLVVMSMSKVTSNTNGVFTEMRQVLSLEATEPQLLDFLGSVAATNSTLRVESLSLRRTPDRSRVQASVGIMGDYRSPAANPSQQFAAAQAQQLVLSKRRHLRQAALDCYNVTTKNLPSGWTLESLNFDSGKRLSVHGVAPADQVRLLSQVTGMIAESRISDQRALFQPSSCVYTMRMVPPGLTNFSWAAHFDLMSPELR
jgi:hypothetical protein